MHDYNQSNLDVAIYIVENASASCTYILFPLTCLVYDQTDYCIFTTVVTEGAVRLVGGSTDNEGRVEVYHNDAWGTVCDDGWDINDANVVCQQLGYSRATFALGMAAFGEGSGPVYYDKVACTGTEARLADCPHPGIGSQSCGHDEDAGVVCYVTPGKFRVWYSTMKR